MRRAAGGHDRYVICIYANENVNALRDGLRGLAPHGRLVSWWMAVMDIVYPLVRCMSQHMPILGLLGFNGDSLILSHTFSNLRTDTRVLWNIVE